MIDHEAVDAALLDADRRNKRRPSKPPSEWPEVDGTCSNCGRHTLRLRSEQLMWPKAIVAVMVCEGCGNETTERRWWRPRR